MSDADARLGIEFISVLGLPPVPFVKLVAGLGCRRLSFAIAPLTANPLNYPAWSFRDDPGLRRDTVAALGDHGVAVSLGDGFLGRGENDLADSGPDLDILRELGAPQVNVISLDGDLPRALDQLGTLVELAASRGLETVLEFIPGLPIGDLGGALAALRHVGRQDFRLAIDMMHVFRSGSSVDDLAAVDPALVGYIQLCDVPLVAQIEDYAHESVHERLPPGAGELPLRAALAVLPQDVTVGIEVPQLSLAKYGVAPPEQMIGVVAAARSVLQQVVA